MTKIIEDSDPTPVAFPVTEFSDEVRSVVATSFTPTASIAGTQQTVEVIAPSALPGGYEFFVDAGGNRSLKVGVPPGGVVQGQRFNAVVISEVDRGSHGIPSGRWRDELCDCCAFGFCHPHLCLSFWCTLCALGQVMTRMKLNYCAKPLNGRQVATTAFKTMFIITVAYWVLHFIFQLITAAVPDFVIAVRILAIAFWLFAWFATTKTRAYIRRKYSVPQGCCGACDDLCCSFWCQTCTICQMARHTADYHTHPAGCCTENGLNYGAPDVV